MSKLITIDDLDDLAVGAAILGTGGGGDPYIGKLMARAAIEAHGPVRLLALDELADDLSIVACGAMGAPTILIEKIPSGEEMGRALDLYARYTGRTLDALIPFEAGGINSTIPIMAAAKLGLPVIDADGMGRAFPQLEMETFNVYGVPAKKSIRLVSTSRCCALASRTVRPIPKASDIVPGTETRRQVAPSMP